MRVTQTVTGTDQDRLEPVSIEVIEGPSKGARFLFTEGTLSIGSGDNNDLVLDDSAVSRRHATMELLPGQVRLRDLGSHNGTWYLGARISEVLVPVGATVKLGRSVLQIFLPEASALASVREELHGLHGRSEAMRRLFASIEQVGPQELTVLITGETGVGKGQVARAIHLQSPRAEKPFVVFDCAAVHAGLAESELFGHIRGAFTGAERDRAGAAERATGGTLFLDEVGELKPELQPKLLRILETREYRRVGDSQDRTADFRLVAATNRDLEADVRSGRFRQDLYFRLAVVQMDVPPLRKRPEDIAVIAQRLAEQHAGFPVKLDPATLASFQCARWPGNVRELRNAIERVMTLGASGARALGSATTANDEPAADTFNDARKQALERFERDYLTSLLERHAGNVSAAARACGLARSQLYRLLERHSLVRK